MVTGRNASEMREGGDQSYRAVAAHAEIAHVVEKDNTGCGRGVLGWAKQRANKYVGAARFEEYGSAEVIVPGAKELQLRLQAAFAERRPACDHNTGGLACSMGIDDLDSIAETDAISHGRIVASARERVPRALLYLA